MDAKNNSRIPVNRDRVKYNRLSYSGITEQNNKDISYIPKHLDSVILPINTVSKDEPSISQLKKIGTKDVNQSQLYTLSIKTAKDTSSRLKSSPQSSPQSACQNQQKNSNSARHTQTITPQSLHKTSQSQLLNTLLHIPHSQLKAPRRTRPSQHKPQQSINHTETKTPQTIHNQPKATESIHHIQLKTQLVQSVNNNLLKTQQNLHHTQPTTKTIIRHSQLNTLQGIHHTKSKIPQSIHHIQAKKQQSINQNETNTNSNNSRHLKPISGRATIFRGRNPTNHSVGLAGNQVKISKANLDASPEQKQVYQEMREAGVSETMIKAKEEYDTFLRFSELPFYLDDIKLHRDRQIESLKHSHMEINLPQSSSKDIEGERNHAYLMKRLNKLQSPGLYDTLEYEYATPVPKTIHRPKKVGGLNNFLRFYTRDKRIVDVDRHMQAERERIALAKHENWIENNLKKNLKKSTLPSIPQLGTPKKPGSQTSEEPLTAHLQASHTQTHNAQTSHLQSSSKTNTLGTQASHSEVDM